MSPQNTVFIDRKLVDFALRGVLALIFAALAFWMPQSALLAMTLVFGAFSLVNGAFNLVAAVRHIQKRALGLAAVQRHCRHTYRRRRPGCSLGRHDGHGFFYGLAWGSGRFSPVCWRYPPPFGCVKKSRVKSGLPSVDCSRLSLALSSCGYFFPSGRVIPGRRLAVGLLCGSLWCHAFVLELASSQNAPGIRSGQTKFYGYEHFRFVPP